MHALTVTKARRRVAECDFRFCYLLRASAAKAFQADFWVKEFVDFLHDFLPKKIGSCILDLVDFICPTLATYPASVTFSYGKSVAWKNSRMVHFSYRCVIFDHDQYTILQRAWIERYSSTILYTRFDRVALELLSKIPQNAPLHRSIQVLF